MGNFGSSRKKKRDKNYRYSDSKSVDITPARPSDGDAYRSTTFGESGKFSQSFNPGQAYPPIRTPSAASVPNKPSPSKRCRWSTNGEQSIFNLDRPIYVANYPFNGTAETGELSFIKGDKLEIYDRQT